MELMSNLIDIFTGAAGIAGLILAIIVFVRQVRNDRMAFLSNVIFDTTIPRESRQPFYDEYIAKKGNGTVVKFWLLEGEREKLSHQKQS
jgi:hypothetical protein